LQTTHVVFSQERLGKKSRFFSRAFGGAFSEATSRNVILNDVRLEDFSNFTYWIMHDRIPSLTLDATIRLYVLADRFDSYTLRTSIITSLLSERFKFNAVFPTPSTLSYMMENVPASLPLHRLLVNSVTRPIYRDPSLLEGLPMEFVTAVEDVLEKPYGLCDTCYDRLSEQNLDHCDHFFEQATDFDPVRYLEPEAMAALSG
jgi:hypothetical protein